MFHRFYIPSRPEFVPVFAILHHANRAAQETITAPTTIDTI